MQTCGHGNWVPPSLAHGNTCIPAWIAHVRVLPEPQRSAAFTKSVEQLRGLTNVEEAPLVQNMTAVFDHAAKTLDYVVLEMALKWWYPELDVADSARCLDDLATRAVAENRCDVLALLLGVRRRHMLPWAEVALLRAVRDDDVGNVSLLVAGKVSLLVTQYSGRALACEAGAHNSVDVLALLAVAKADLHAGPEYPLAAAATTGKLEALQYLLAQDVRARTAHDELEVAVVPDTRDELGAAVFAAAVHGHALCVDALVRANADVRGPPHATKRRHGCTPLVAAAAQGHGETVRVLVRCKAAVETAAADGTTALFAAAVGGHAECVLALLEAKADAARARPDGWTPLAAARHRCHAAVVALLPQDEVQMPQAEVQLPPDHEVVVAPGAPRAAREDCGAAPSRAALQQAVLGNNVAELRRLLDVKAKVTEDLLSLTVSRIHDGPLKVLLASDAGEQIMCRTRATLLHTAVKFGRAWAVRLLLSCGGSDAAHLPSFPPPHPPMDGCVERLLLEALRRGQKHARWWRNVPGVVAALVDCKADVLRVGAEALALAAGCPGMSDGDRAALVGTLRKHLPAGAAAAWCMGALHVAVRHGSRHTAHQLVLGAASRGAVDGTAALEGLRPLPAEQAAEAIAALAKHGVDFGGVRVRLHGAVTRLWPRFELPVAALVKAKADVDGCLVPEREEVVGAEGQEADVGTAVRQLVCAKAAGQADLDALVTRLVAEAAGVDSGVDGQGPLRRLSSLVRAFGADCRQLDLQRHLARAASAPGSSGEGAARQVRALARVASTGAVTAACAAVLRAENAAAVSVLLAAKADAGALAENASARCDVRTLGLLQMCGADLAALLQDPSGPLLQQLVRSSPGGMDLSPFVERAVRQGRTATVERLLQVKADAGKVADLAVAHHSDAVVQLLLRTKADVGGRVLRVPLASAGGLAGQASARQLGAWRGGGTAPLAPVGLLSRTAPPPPRAAAPRKRKTALAPNPQCLVDAVRSGSAKAAVVRLLAAKADAGPATCHALREADADACMRQLTLLRQAGADVGLGFFLLAARTGNLPTVEYFVRAGVQVGEALGDGRTALHYAAFHRHVAVASRLLAAKADPDAVDASGYTPAQLGPDFVRRLA